MTYACFPDEERATVRPLMGVMGEGLGDVWPCGLLALLLLINPALPVKPGLLSVAVCSFAFWWICRSLERNINVIGMKTGKDLAVTATTKYSGMAHESVGIV